MMGLLSTIRGKKEAVIGSGIGSAQVGPLNTKTKKLVIQEWPRVLAHCPELFTEIWHISATRSTSIKLAFGIAENESPMHNAAFLGLSSTFQAFFYILWSKTRDFISRDQLTLLGHLLVCMAEKIDETLSSYMTEEDKKNEMILAWQRVVNSIVHQMRNGYSHRRIATTRWIKRRCQ
ncbi:hypothetical protein CAEBREN_29467 [Caenorhabditis brenneri]|uniref:Uncharacterized protein n=1 Tax=Caenorhabditis brenneri TaxID=135651 RepID=G0PE63_CAEBE|nr:hypothetical protein CAEBREN_29467 [Caenorhabditis brenneri]